MNANKVMAIGTILCLIGAIFLIAMPSKADFAAERNGNAPNSYYSSSIKVGDHIFAVYMGFDINYSTGFYAATYDGSNWSTPHLIELLNVEAHGIPELIRNSTGYLFVFYGASNSDIHVARSTYPDNTSAWTLLTPITGEAMYLHPIINPYNNSFYIFYRHITISEGSDIYVYRISENNGVSWTQAKTLMNDSEFSSNREFVNFDSVEYTNRYIIPFAWDIDNGIYGSNRMGAYYAYFDLTNSHIYNVTGFDLGISIIGFPEMNYTRVGSYGWNKETTGVTTVLLHNKNPIVIFNLGFDDIPNGDIAQTNAPYSSVSVIWNGFTWTELTSVIQTTQFWLNAFTIFPESNGNITIYTQNTSDITGLNPYEDVCIFHYNHLTNHWTKVSTILTLNDLQYKNQYPASFFFAGDGAKVENGESQKMVMVGEFYFGIDGTSADITRWGIYGQLSDGSYGWVINGTNIEILAPPPNTPNQYHALVILMIMIAIISIGTLWINQRRDEFTPEKIVYLLVSVLLAGVMIPIAVVLLLG